MSQPRWIASRSALSGGIDSKISVYAFRRIHRYRFVSYNMQERTHSSADGELFDIMRGTTESYMCKAYKPIKPNSHMLCTEESEQFSIQNVRYLLL